VRLAAPGAPSGEERLVRRVPKNDVPQRTPREVPALRPGPAQVVPATAGLLLPSGARSWRSVRPYGGRSGWYQPVHEPEELDVRWGVAALETAAGGDPQQRRVA